MFDAAGRVTDDVRRIFVWPFGSGKEAKNRFLTWRLSWISDRSDFSYFYLQVTLMLPTNFRVKWPLG